MRSRDARRLEDCLYHPEGFERLVVMPARDCLGNSSEWLAGRHSRNLVAELRRATPIASSSSTCRRC